MQPLGLDRTARIWELWLPVALSGISDGFRSAQPRPVRRRAGLWDVRGRAERRRGRRYRDPRNWTWEIWQFHTVLIHLPALRLFPPTHTEDADTCVREKHHVYVTQVTLMHKCIQVHTLTQIHRTEVMNKPQINTGGWTSEERVKVNTENGMRGLSVYFSAAGAESESHNQERLMFRKYRIEDR